MAMAPNTVRRQASNTSTSSSTITHSAQFTGVEVAVSRPCKWFVWYGLVSFNLSVIFHFLDGIQLFIIPVPRKKRWIIINY